MKTQKSLFTLIELLVVIAIIAILAAILMPALSSARERAKNMNCMNNLKSWGTALNLYADHYNDWYPVNGTWGRYNDMDRWYYVTGKMLGINTSQVKKRENVLLFCPSDTNLAGVNGWAWASHSYGYNYQYFGAQHYSTPNKTKGMGRKRTYVKFPSITLIVGEKGGMDDSYSRGTASHILYSSEPTAGSTPTNRHNGYANLTFPDGHAAPKLREELLYRTNSYVAPINKFFGYADIGPQYLTGE